MSNQNKIISTTTVDEGANKVIIYEYENGARSYKTIKPKRPLYKKVWFYILLGVVLLVLFAVLGSLTS